VCLQALGAGKICWRGLCLDCAAAAAVVAAAAANGWVGAGCVLLHKVLLKFWRVDNGCVQHSCMACMLASMQGWQH
jgi:hypothetical protein